MIVPPRPLAACAGACAGSPPFRPSARCFSSPAPLRTPKAPKAWPGGPPDPERARHRRDRCTRREPLISRLRATASRSSATRRNRVTARRTIDANGLIVAPGFIDPHTHTAGDLSSADPKRQANLAYLMQGVTTVITNNDGGGPIDIGKQLDGWTKRRHRHERARSTSGRDRSDRP